jgi:hypothetical protein
VRARCKDGNHKEIVKEFERFGCVVEDMTAKDNFCDVHVSDNNGSWAWVEIKNGKKAPLTDGEIKFRDKCQQLNEPYFIVRTLADVSEVLKQIKE